MRSERIIGRIILKSWKEDQVSTEMMKTFMKERGWFDEEMEIPECDDPWYVGKVDKDELFQVPLNGRGEYWRLKKEAIEKEKGALGRWI